MRRSSAISRRDFLAIGAALPLSAVVIPQTRRPRVPVGLELYSVRTEYMRDLPATVTAVAGMGYEIVEFWAPYYQWTTAQAKDVRKLLDDLGIRCLSTHNSGASVTPDGLDKAIELNQIIGSRAIVQASAPQASGIDDWKRLAEKLTGFADKLRPLGMSTGYHNHQIEWRLLEGQRPMDVIAANTPGDVILQFDVGTCVEAGADPIAWINANPGRIKSVHCKDWGAGTGRGYSVAFGEGDAPWIPIFEAVEATGGIEYYLIEQEQSPPGQQLTMAQRCLENYRKLRGY
jgi:sugar phosphate isomerase/epimerase